MQLVLWVGRGSESSSFDGSQLEKRPDPSIVLSGTDPRFPLVAEVTILYAPASKTVALYCEHGIRRFVEGEYAWANGDAFMIPYVRDGWIVDQDNTEAIPVRNCAPVSSPVSIGSTSGPRWGPALPI